MRLLHKLNFLKLVFLLNFLFLNVSNADNHNIYETLEIIKNDLKTLERAVYSGSIEIKKTSTSETSSSIDLNSEDVLTRHLLKLSEVEDQFRDLTNKFEEINFKLDKLSNRLTKIQADNQVRFEEIDTELVSINSNNKSNGSNQLSLKPKVEEQKILPGSSQPQLLGTITYKDTETSDTSQVSVIRNNYLQRH